MKPFLQQSRASILIFLYVILGALLIRPLVTKLPLLGWDWYYFFNQGNPDYNLFSPTSAYPPFTKYFIGMLTQGDWRDSFALLNGITLMTIAIATWKAGGRYGSVILALLSPPVWFLMWVGHPDALALLGAITNFIPLALIKPQLVAWTVLRSRTLLFFTGIFLMATFLVWGFWPLNLGQAIFEHPASFGWAVLGWLILILGLLMLPGSGKSFYGLMAAGCLISPYLMPYHLAVLVPALGQVQGRRKILLWSSSWLLCIGLGLGSSARFLNFIFPLLVFFFSVPPADYRKNLQSLLATLRALLPSLEKRKPAYPSFNLSESQGPGAS